MKELLHKFDEEGAYEFPRNCDLDYSDFEAKAHIVYRRIQKHLSEATSFEDGLSNQDASFSLSSRLTLLFRGARRLRLISRSSHCLRNDSLGSFLIMVLLR